MVFRRGFDPFQQLRSEMENLSHFTPRSVAARVFPALNIWEQGDELFAEAELPGVKSENLDISVIGSQLTIKGQRQDTAEDRAAYHRRERGLGAFTRVVRLPFEINAARVQATLHDGILLITLPKAESAKPRKIQVSSTNS
jgi:HSP20 family protein